MTDRQSQRRLFLSIWEYLGEIVLAVLCCALVLSLFTLEEVHAVLCKLRGDLLVGVITAWALSAAIWIGMIAILASDFGKWLRRRGEAAAYSRALATPVIVYALVVALLIGGACSENRFMIEAKLLALAYSAINLVTIVRNVHGLVVLWQTWEQNPQ